MFAGPDGMERHTLKVGQKPMLPTPANIMYANRLMVKIRALVDAQAYRREEFFPKTGDAGQAGTVGQHLDHWLALQTHETSTMAGYTSAVRFWKGLNRKGPRHPDGLEEKMLVGLRHSDILKALKRKRLHGKTQKNYIAVLHEALDLAVKDKLLDSNPCDGVDHADWQEEDPDPFDLAEADRIVGYMVQHFHPWVGNMVEWRFFSGVRTSEMVGLQRPSVRWKKRQVGILEAVVRGERKNTKTNVARWVDLNSRAYAALERQCKPLPPPAADHDSVWMDPQYGTPWYDERAFRRSFWTTAFKALGIRYRPPNNMRHTYATMMLMAGAEPAYAAKQMGHSVEVFLKTYAKWIDGGENEREQAKLESFIATATRPAASP